MRQEKIHDALEFLDDDMILQTEKLRQNSKKKSFRYLAYAGLAASFLLVVTGVKIYTDSHQGLESTKESAVSESADSSPIQTFYDESEIVVYAETESQEENVIKLKVLDILKGEAKSTLLLQKDTPETFSEGQKKIYFLKKTENDMYDEVQGSENRTITLEEFQKEIQ